MPNDHSHDDDDDEHFFHSKPRKCFLLYIFLSIGQSGLKNKAYKLPQQNCFFVKAGSQERLNYSQLAPVLN